MESLKNLIIYIGIHGFLLLIGFVLAGILITLKEHINKINWLIRFMILPLAILLSLFAVSMIVNNLVAIISLFWLQVDVGLSVWIYGNIILPAATTYFLIWTVYFISPFYKTFFSVLVGTIWLALCFFSLYIALNYEIYIDNYLFDLFSIQTGIFGTIVYVLSSIVAMSFAIISSIDGELD